MRRWWWTVLIVAVVGPAQAAVVVGDGASLWAERVVAYSKPDGLMRVMVEPVVRRATTGPTMVFYGLPANDLKVGTLPSDVAVFPQVEREPEVRRPWLFTTCRVFLRILRDQRQDAQAAERQGGSPWTMPAAESSEARILEPEEIAAFGFDEPHRAWAKSQQEAGNRIVAMEVIGDAPIVRGPAMAAGYRTKQGFIPFSAVPLPGVEAAAADQPFELQFTALAPVMPTYPDGYPLFPTSAIRYAFAPTPEIWRAINADAPPEMTFSTPAFVACYRANVPLTARSEDIVLTPTEDEPVLPAEPRVIDIPKPVPVDALAGFAVLIALAAFVIRRRRRKAGTTSSATAPGPS